MFELKRAMAPRARRERALISSGGETVCGTEFGGDFAQKPCNVFSLYLVETIVRKICCQNGGRGYRVGAQVKDAADDGADGAKQVMAANHYFWVVNVRETL